MTLVSQKMSVELQSIERALGTGQITPDEAEYLIQQHYQIAMMQFEVFTLLHDALEQKSDSLPIKPRVSRGKVLTARWQHGWPPPLHVHRVNSVEKGRVYTDFTTCSRRSYPPGLAWRIS
jgi:hypothetical protein